MKNQMSAFALLVLVTVVASLGSVSSPSEQPVSKFLMTVCASSESGCDYQADGTADQEQVQGAIDSCPAYNLIVPDDYQRDQDAACVVRLVGGLFTLDAPVIMRSGVFIEGLGGGFPLDIGGVTTIRLADGANSDLFLWPDAPQMVAFTGLSKVTLDGNRQNNTIGDCIDMGNATNGVIENFVVRHCPEVGVRLSRGGYASRWVRVQDGSVWSNGTHGVEVGGSSGIFLYQINSDENGWAGFYIHSSYQVYLEAVFSGGNGRANDSESCNRAGYCIRASKIGVFDRVWSENNYGPAFYLLNNDQLHGRTLLVIPREAEVYTEGNTLSALEFVGIDR